MKILLTTITLLMEIGPTWDFFVFPANRSCFAGKSFRGQICSHCLRPPSPSYQGLAPALFGCQGNGLERRRKVLFFLACAQQWTISGGHPLPSLFNVLIVNFLLPPIAHLLISIICHHLESDPGIKVFLLQST